MILHPRFLLLCFVIWLAGVIIFLLFEKQDLAGTLDDQGLIVEQEHLAEILVAHLVLGEVVNI